MLKPVRNLLDIANDLVAILEKIEKVLNEMAAKHVAASITHFFVLRSVRTLRAVVLLYETGLEEQAQVLVRVLLETWPTFGCFAQLAVQNEREACERFLDAMMLQKIKQLRAAGFVGLELIPGGPSKEYYEKMEAEICARYSSEDVAQMRRHGFSGLSAEQRAARVGFSSEYDIAYRNFSRNVHSTDYLEHVLLRGGQEGINLDLYYEARDRVGISTALRAAQGIAALANQVAACGLEAELEQISTRHRAIMGEKPPARR